MIDALKRLLSPEYLVVADPGPLGGLWPLYAALGLLFGLGLAGAVWALAGPRRHEAPPARRAWAWFELWVCLAGMAVVAARFAGLPGWSARIWPYTLAALTLAGHAAYRFRRRPLPPWLADTLRLLAFLPTRPGGEKQLPLVPWRFWAGVVAHVAGLALVASVRYGWPVWSAPLLLLLLLLPQAPLVARGTRPRLATLAPLLAAYGTTLLWALYLQAGITVRAWQGLLFPDPMTSLFYVDGIILAAVVYALLAGVYVTSRALARPHLFWRVAAAGLLAATLLWAGVVYFGKRTHGATASDPYAYAQMGVDLAERGTFAHRFSLFQEVIPLDIAWAPLQPVGYHIPRNDLGDCPSVWATGASALLAAGYLLLSETGLYVTTPVVALLALAATWALAQHVLRGQPAAVRHLTAALAVALLATSPEHVDRLLVPMADAAAQLFTVLTLLFLLRGAEALAAPGRGGTQGRLSPADWLLAGLCFAWAFWVRHTQLVMGISVFLAAAIWGRRYAGRPAAGRKEGNPDRPTSRSTDPRMRRSATLPILALALFAAAALAGAVPDIVYRWRWFGSPFATETTELPLMALAHVVPVAVETARAALVAGEWGYLFPLALFGGWRLWRAAPRRAAVLATAFAAILLVHLTYRALRLRDLISLFPLVNLAIAYGAVTLLRRARHLAARRPQRLGTRLLPAAVVAWIVLSLALSRWAMIDNVWKPGWASFGYMRAGHRAAFDELAALTEPEAVIGASLNAGAVAMYTGRAPIRPYDSWTRAEWETFLAAMERHGRPVYLLDDGGLMADFIAAEGQRRQLAPIAELYVPLFYTRDRETGWLYRVGEALP